MNTLALIPGMSGASEVLVIFLAVLLLFGGKKIPELARSLGKSIGEFKRGQSESSPEKKIEKQADPADPDEPGQTGLKK